MLIVAERINATRKSVRQALEEKKADFFIQEAKKQEEAGAHFIDVNAGANPEREAEDLPWIVEVIQDKVSIPLCLDSANHEAISEALRIYKKDEVMINSFTAEEERMEAILPLAAEYGASVVGLAMGEGGITESAKDRMKLVEKLVVGVEKYNIPREKLLVDPLVVPVGTDQTQGKVFLETLANIKRDYPEVKTICGLSNVSFGLPNRRLINRAFMALCVGYGLEAVILDPTDLKLVAILLASEVLMGRDEFCVNYLAAYRRGALEV